MPVIQGYIRLQDIKVCRARLFGKQGTFCEITSFCSQLRLSEHLIQIIYLFI